MVTIQYKNIRLRKNELSSSRHKHKGSKGKGMPKENIFGEVFNSKNILD